ncbi:hypothetical protein ACPOL_4099 [Acidisarcina polymorpha]|uniref:Putative zinc-finger domain-containing protein n=1 Tax=Acidisarcina polymorpha TaxID=2211140 RepID=A0A2Z5G4D0_9BACT|nr:zf-HC2 domain-containing protein [Acidisarcina polymorpha]AXC13376.1 hypothetical protein ACPOL_4099 [Acidisarcina polymorpha]
MNSCDEFYGNVQLYVDGELTPEEGEHLFSHMETCELCRQCLAEAEAYSSRIRAARPSLTAPDSLRASVLRRMQAAESQRARPMQAPRQRTSTSRLWSVGAIAALLAIFAASVLSYYQQRQRGTNVMLQTAAVAHQDLLQNSVPLDISSNSPEAVAAWFTSRVSFPFRMADSGLAASDGAKYKVTGGRLLTAGNERLAMVSFSMSNEVISMLVGPGSLYTASGGKVVKSGGIEFHSRDEGSFHIVTWNNRGLSYVLTSAISMGNAHKCSACHDQNPSAEEPHQVTKLNRRGYWQSRAEPLVAVAAPTILLPPGDGADGSRR